MTSPEAPSPEEMPANAEPARKKRWTWHLIFRLMLSPMAFLAPCFSCGASITAAHAFGPVAGVLGAVGGFLLGSLFIFFWYFVIVDHFKDENEEEFAARLTADAEAGRLGRQLGRPPVARAAVEAIPLDAASAIDLSTDLGSAVARIDIHEDAAEALTAAEALKTKHSRDARAIACLARALLRAGRPKEGVRMAGEAFHSAVLTDQMSVVTRLVQSFWSHREALALEPAVAIAIADHLDAEDQANRAAFFRSGRTSLL